jgi:hypothetical protein
MKDKLATNNDTKLNAKMMNSQDRFPAIHVPYKPGSAVIQLQYRVNSRPNIIRRPAQK